MTTIQQSAPLVCLDRVVLGCCGLGGRDAIGNNDNNNIGGGTALDSENNNQQTMGVRAMMATRQLRGNEDIDDVRPRPPNTQQPAIGRGWGGGDKDNKEEEYNGCWRMAGKVASAPAKRRRGAIVFFCVWWMRNAAVDAVVQQGVKTAKMD